MQFKIRVNARSGGVLSQPDKHNNPIAIAIPAGAARPFLLDMAISVVAMGKIMLAAKAGREIPDGWASDKKGNPTRDPRQALDGGLILPVGGYKGYGMAVAVEFLCGVLTGAGFGRVARSMTFDFEGPQQLGHFFVALDISRFMPLPQFNARAEAYVAELKAAPKAAGTERILMPGEPEEEVAAARSRDGIPLAPEIARELETLAQEVGVPVPWS